MIEVIYACSNPIQLMGQVAGVCYDSPNNPEANYKRGMRNVKDNHGRVFEFPDVILSIDGYSARCIRELYTHIIGTTRLQASTRYITYDNMDYYTPDTLKDDPVYHKGMETIKELYQQLIDQGYKKEDVANVLPLGMHSRMVLKINFRAMLHLAEMRMCLRAYKEIRDLLDEFISVIAHIDDEWAVLMSYMKSKCKICTEKENCPRNRV